MPLFGAPNVQRMKAKGDVKGLIKALGYTKDIEIRVAAAEALGQLGDVRALDALIAALGEDDYFVSKAAALALGMLRDPRAVEHLIEALHYSQGTAREGAAAALGMIGDKRAVEPLIEALDDDHFVKIMAVKSLLAIGDPRAIEPVIFYTFPSDMPEDYPMVSKGLMQFAVEQKLEPLIKALRGDPPAQWRHDRSSQPNLHKRAIYELAKLKDDRAVQVLINLLYEGEPYEQANAAKALGEAGELSAVEALTERLHDKEHFVSQRAKEALDQIRKMHPA